MKLPMRLSKEEKIPIYHTPEQWEELTGKKLLDSDPVWEWDEFSTWRPALYVDSKKRAIYYGGIDIVVNVVGQPAPPKDYRI